MTINCKGKLLDLSYPKVMGILNLTPDSFYDGGKYKSEKDILSQVENMLNEGASIIDIGAYSSRPNAVDISVDEEKRRLIPILNLINSKFKEVTISVDTFRSEVANEALQVNAAIINDISAGVLDSNMMAVVSNYNVPYIMMHMKGTPQTMKSLTKYDNFLVDIKMYFSKQINKAIRLGINDIIIDPGFGFAKDINQNYTLLKHLDTLKTLERPILCGISRKSMIYNTLNTTSKEALNGTTALHSYALLNGAKILRVHDVKEAVECIKLYQAYNEN